MKSGQRRHSRIVFTVQTSDLKYAYMRYFRGNMPDNLSCKHLIFGWKILAGGHAEPYQQDD